MKMAKTFTWLGLTLCVSGALGCGGDDDTGEDGSNDGPDSAPSDTPDAGVYEGPLYAASSIVAGEGTLQTGYVSVQRSLALDGAKLDLGDAYEFPGPADMWVWGGALFVASGEAPTITRFTVDEQGQLVEGDTVSFADYGILSTAFWNNTFVSETKAYMINDVAEYVVWNPETMAISGTIDIPELEAREGLIPRAASTDRGNVVYNGRLFQPFYWSDVNYANRADDSLIAVFDVETDQLEEILSAPCPGLDVGTVDEGGTLYFSNWTGGAGTHLVLGTAANCVAAVDGDTLEVSVPFHFADVADGREGAVFHALGDGRYVFSTFHDERVDLEGATDPFSILAGPNWLLWTWDPKDGTAAPLESEPADSSWNSGAVYWFQVDGSAHALIPAADYASSIAYEVSGEGAPIELFGIDGYGIRLQQIR